MVMKLAKALLSSAGATANRRSVQAVSSVILGSGNGRRYSEVVCSIICLKERRILVGLSQTLLQ
jgi:hypothetical protein